MKKSMLILSVIGLLMTLQIKTYSQNNLGKTPVDGLFDKRTQSANSLNRVPIPYTSIRESDVMWSKRVWRVIDLRQKINLPFYYPIDEQQGRKSLMQIIYNGIKENSITAYGTDDEEFLTPLTAADLSKKLDRIDTIQVTSTEPPYDVHDSVVNNKFNPSDVVLIRVKEDWFFDKQRSVMDVRIIGLCPVKELYDDQGEFKAMQPIFWVYFPECRKLFATNEVYNKFNDAERRTYDDIFFKRLFGSYIYKESNVYDRKIGQYTKGMDALLEAERIKNDIFNIEHDLWEY